LLIELELSSLEPDEEIIIVGANVKQN